jgi:lysozyme
MKTSYEGARFIAYFEGFKSKIYICPAGELTIGFGHVVHDNDIFKEEMTLKRAYELLKEDLSKREQVLDHLDLKQNEFDALMSFVFNVGATAFKNSTLYELIKNGKIGIGMEFSKWIHVHGKVVDGLVKRRKAEADLFVNGRYYYQYGIPTDFTW